MNHLFISWAFPPMNYPRAIQVARLASHMNVPLKILCAGSGDVGIESERLSVMRLNLPLWQSLFDKIRFRISPRTQFNPDPYVIWAQMIAQHVIKNHKFSKGDVLVTFGQPMSDHLAGLMIKREINLPWIAHFSDPWIDNPFIQRSGAILQRSQSQEHDVIENADIIAFTSEETFELVMAKYPDKWLTKARVLPHAFEASLYPCINSKTRGDQFVLRYMGNFYGNRTPGPLISALNTIWMQTPEILNGVRVEIFGSLEKGLLEKIDISSLPEDCLRFFPPVNYQESLNRMVEADLLLVIDAPSDFSVFLPSKLIDYIGAKKPIFGITPPGTSAKLIRDLGGWVVDPEDTYEISRQLSKVLAELRLGKYSYPWGNEDVRERFEASNVARKMEEYIREVAVLA